MAAPKLNKIDQITANKVPNAGKDITTYPNRAKDTESNVFLSDMLITEVIFGLSRLKLDGTRRYVVCIPAVTLITDKK